VHASTLLDTHHHAVIETPAADLGRGMGLVLGGHAAWLNRRHDVDGSVFSAHFWSVRVTDPSHFLRASVYSILNPVAAGLVRHPREWLWSSYASMVADGCTPRLALLLEEDVAAGQRAFLELVERASVLVRQQRLSDRDAFLRAIDMCLPVPRTASVVATRPGHG
jgi:hypothetical protein